MWKHFPCTLPKLKGAKVQLFQGRKQNLYSFLFTLQKLHLCTLIFLYLFFGPEIKEINHAVAPPKVVWLEPCLLQFLKFVQNCLNGPKNGQICQKCRKCLNLPKPPNLPKIHQNCQKLQKWPKWPKKSKFCQRAKFAFKLPLKFNQNWENLQNCQKLPNLSEIAKIA